MCKKLCAKDKDYRLSDEEAKTVRSGGQPLAQEDGIAKMKRQGWKGWLIRWEAASVQVLDNV